MSSQEEHEADCSLLIGNPWSKVHRWLDASFSRYGIMHRQCRHHTQGVDVVRSMWGDEAAVAAQIHIVKDCRHIPDFADYENGMVDNMGYNITGNDVDAEKLLQSLLKRFEE